MKRPQRHGDGRTHGSGGRGEESAMGLNVFRDEARAFVAALGTAAADEETVLKWLDEEVAELKASRGDRARLCHQVYDVLFLLFSLAAARDLDLDREWELGRAKSAKYLSES